MSTDDRLDRLGLRHLRDKPEELKKALEAGIAENEQETKALHARRESARLAEMEARFRELDYIIPMIISQAGESPDALLLEYEALRAEIARLTPR